MFIGINLLRHILTHVSFLFTLILLWLSRVVRHACFWLCVRVKRTFKVMHFWFLCVNHSIWWDFPRFLAINNSATMSQEKNAKLSDSNFGFLSVYWANTQVKRILEFFETKNLCILTFFGQTLKFSVFKVL